MLNSNLVYKKGGWETKTGHNAPLYARPDEYGNERILNVVSVMFLYSGTFWVLILDFTLSELLHQLLDLQWRPSQEARPRHGHLWAFLYAQPRRCEWLQRTGAPEGTSWSVHARGRFLGL